MRLKQIAPVGLFLMAVLLVFQNCSEVNFSSGNSTPLITTMNNPTPTVTLPVPSDDPLKVDGLTTTEDVPLVFSSAKGNAISVIGANGPSERLTTQIDVTDGTFSWRNDIAPAAIIGLESFTGNGMTTVILVGTAEAINTALDGASYKSLPDHYTVDSTGAPLVWPDIKPARLSVTTTNAANSSVTARAEVRIRAVVDIQAIIVQTTDGIPTKPFLLTTFDDPASVIIKINGMAFGADGTLTTPGHTNNIPSTIGFFSTSAEGLVFHPQAGFLSPIDSGGRLEPTFFRYEVAAGNSPSESTFFGVQVSASPTASTFLPTGVPTLLMNAVNILATYPTKKIVGLGLKSKNL